MPKRPNAKKLAAKELQKQKVLASAEAGEYVVARVVKGLGFCQFLLEGPAKSEIKGLVRGLNKGGGVNSTSFIRAGCYVMLSCTEAQAKRSPHTIWEIAGVANKRDEISRLQESGRVSSDEDLDELFDYSGEEAAQDTNQDIWADANPNKKKAAQMRQEAASQAAELLSRYRKAEAGVKSKVAACVHVGRHVVAETEEVEAEAEEGFALWDAAEGAPAKKDSDAPMPARREITSKRRLAAIAAAEAAIRAAEEAEVAAAWRLANAEYEFEQAALAEFEHRPIPAKWDDDEVDIDAI